MVVFALFSRPYEAFLVGLLFVTLGLRPKVKVETICAGLAWSSSSPGCVYCDIRNGIELICNPKKCVKFMDMNILSHGSLLSTCEQN